MLLRSTQLGHEPGDRLPHRPPRCFFQRYENGAWQSGRAGLERPGNASTNRARWTTARHDDTLARLAAVIEARRGGDPDKSYVARLFAKGPDAILKKIGEEATEIVMAAKDGDRARGSSPRWPTCGSTP